MTGTSDGLNGRPSTVVFYDEKTVGRPLVRFAFCKRDAVIDEAAARLAALS